MCQECLLLYCLTDGEHVVKLSFSQQYLGFDSLGRFSLGYLQKFVNTAVVPVHQMEWRSRLSRVVHEPPCNTHHAYLVTLLPG